MATILLSAAGAALGSGFGGTVLGLSGAVIGRAVGATVGRAIDQRLFGLGADPVETGKTERFRVTGASEGTAIPRLWGRMRVPGHVIWASRFSETATSTGGGKGTSPSPTTNYSYSVSLAAALCEGEVRAVGRIWADGIEISPASLNLRFYPGTEDQLPDPKIEAVEGIGLAPAYRGIAYVVIEDLDLARFGNRVPQFNFEVIRPAQGAEASPYADAAQSVTAVAMIPGTGEYALATTPVYFEDAPGVSRATNLHTLSGETDFATSLGQLEAEMPAVGAVSLVVSWFGSDLRCGACTLRPKVEQSAQDAAAMPWGVTGVTRAGAAVLPQVEGQPVYGGTPADASVVEAIEALNASGKSVMFYPFVLMDQLAGNNLPDPWTGATGQPALPWRGRITTSLAPGIDGTPDRSAAAEAEVAAFFGAAGAGDFAVSGQTVSWAGGVDWGYRRFILHYAHLCVAAGGVAAFCIGSEMRGLTQIRGAGDSFPAVAALRSLAAEVRAILGPGPKITYGADWSEYFGYHTGDNVYFHLDPLWSDPHINAIGIDNYMPLADWRDDEDHADAAWGSIHNLGYLQSNIEGGEGFDWYYDSPEGETYQIRKPITDGLASEPWVFRFKDLRSWWQNAHHERIGGVRSATPTQWVPQSKPIWFTEFGCAAIDKGANQPNLFLDPKSSESALPRASNGQRDDLMQAQYLRAVTQYWADPARNPLSGVYGGPMIDTTRLFAWAWDARPYPTFPLRGDVWGDRDNYSHGHWLNGRSSNQLLAGVIAEICADHGLPAVDLEAAQGIVRGYVVSQVASGRSDLQPLVLGAALDVAEREGVLTFENRDGFGAIAIAAGETARHPDLEPGLEFTRQGEIAMFGRLRLDFTEADGDFRTRTIEAALPDEESDATSSNDMPLVLTASEARALAERWLMEARIGRDTARLALPLSRLPMGVGTILDLEGGLYRVDAVEMGEMQLLDAQRINPALYTAGVEVDEHPVVAAAPVPAPVYPLFMDLPLLTGDEEPHAPHIAVAASPWMGDVALWSSSSDAGYALNRMVTSGATLGLTETVLAAAAAGVWDKGAALRVRLSVGALSSAAELDVLAGGNTALIGDGTLENWEVIQFQTATLVGPNTYELSLRLRGQAGSNGTMPASWPVGSRFVLITPAVGQVVLASSARGVLRHYRVGLASLGLADHRVVHREFANPGIGLRPYSVAHLTARGGLGQAVTLDWIRRGRIDADSWDVPEIPLGETSERYLVRVLSGALVRREVEVTAPSWTYSPSEQVADGAGPGDLVQVAQISDRFGAGPFVSAML